MQVRMHNHFQCTYVEQPYNGWNPLRVTHSSSSWLGQTGIPMQTHGGKVDFMQDLKLGESIPSGHQ